MRVVNPVTPGLGGPQVIRRRDGSQGPAHASRGTTGFWLALSMDARKSIAEMRTEQRSRSDREKRSATSIFPQPFGVRIGNRPERLDLSGNFGRRPTHL